MTTTKASLFVAAAAALLVLSTHHEAAEAGTPGVDEIVAKTNHASYYQGKDGRASVTMTIIDKQNRKRVRKLTILRKNVSATKDAEQKFYVYFHKPALRLALEQPVGVPGTCMRKHDVGPAISIVVGHGYG